MVLINLWAKWLMWALSIDHFLTLNRGTNCQVLCICGLRFVYRKIEFCVFVHHEQSLCHHHTISTINDATFFYLWQKIQKNEKKISSRYWESNSQSTVVQSVELSYSTKEHTNSTKILNNILGGRNIMTAKKNLIFVE